MSNEGKVSATKATATHTNLDNEIKASPLPPKPEYKDRGDIPDNNREIPVDENKVLGIYLIVLMTTGIVLRSISKVRINLPVSH
jgi:hypothetical protein